MEAISPAAAVIGNPRNSSAIRWSAACGRRIKTGQPQGATQQVNESNDPADPRKSQQHDPIDHQGRRQSEGNNIGERIEFSPERTVVAPKPGQPSVQNVEDTGTQNEPDREMEKLGGGVRIGGLEQRALHNLERRGESAEQIPRRHQVRQEIDFRIRRTHLSVEPGNHRGPTCDAVTHFHQHLGLEWQVYFRSRPEANHPKVLPFPQLVADLRPAYNPARDHSGKLPHHERSALILESPRHARFFVVQSA